MYRSQRGPSRCGLKTARPMFCSSFSTTWASARSAASADPARLPTWMPSQRTDCVTTTCTRPRCARRRAHVLLPDATITRMPCPASPKAPPVIPAATATSRSKMVSSRRSSCSTATTRMPSASGTSRRRTRSRLQARMIAGLSVEASSASTVFSAARPTSIIPNWFRTTIRSKRRRLRKRVTT